MSLFLVPSVGHCDYCLMLPLLMIDPAGEAADRKRFLEDLVPKVRLLLFNKNMIIWIQTRARIFVPMFYYYTGFIYLPSDDPTSAVG